MPKIMKIDIGGLCTHCGIDTSFETNNGKFVNRIPCDSDAILKLVCGENDIDIPVNVEGFLCPDCQCIECDECGELTLEYELIDQEIPIQLCPNCMAKREVKDA